MISRIVRGNDFSMEVTVVTPQYEESGTIWLDFNITECTDVRVNLICQKDQVVIPLQWHIKDNTDNVIICDVEGKWLHSGAVYALEITGIDSEERAWRFKKKNCFSIVDDTSQAVMQSAIMTDPLEVNAEIGLVVNVIPVEGPQGPQGDRGEDGAQGPQGEKGQDGSVSFDDLTPEQKAELKGDQGPAGAQGEKGDQGPAGAQGEKGQDGSVSFDDLTPEQKAELKGDQGPQGDKGDKGADGQPGPQGDKGDQGPAGENGQDGAQGPKGDQGPAGAQGDKGDQGERGENGQQGPKGEQGEKGQDGSVSFDELTPEQKAELKGDQGPQGERGENGQDGAQGPKGDQGPAGAQGEKGDQGERGADGQPGPQGPKGEQGDGADLTDYYTKEQVDEKIDEIEVDVDTVKLEIISEGPQSPAPDTIYMVTPPITLKTINGIEIVGEGNIEIGSQGGGAQGPQGPQGEKGDQGDRGLDGPQGEKGDQGDRGLDGPQGEKGDQGPAGIQGPMPGFQTYTKSNKTGLVSTLATYFNTSIGDGAVIEGSGTSQQNIEASGNYSHAEGQSTKAIGRYSHAEGYSTTAEQQGAHAEGWLTVSHGQGAHAEGLSTYVNAQQGAHAEGNGTQALGLASHAANKGTQATNIAETSIGHYNVSTLVSGSSFDNTSSTATLFSVGNGTADNARHNAFEIKQNGDIYLNDGNKLQNVMVTSTTNGLKIEVVQSMPASPDANTIYIVQ